MREAFLQMPAGRVQVTQYGDGPRLLIALHGYGDNGRSFLPMGQALSGALTVLVPDLPFHGQTRWQSNRFEPGDILQMLSYLQRSMGADHFSLLGHSMGGRLALHLLPDLVDRLDHLFLLAPDGLATPSTQLADHCPLWLRLRLARLTESPAWRRRIVFWAERIGLINRYDRLFLDHHLNDETRQKRLFHTWASMAAFPARGDEMWQKLERGRVPTALFVGRNDPLVMLNKLERRIQGMDHLQCYLLDRGHRLIRESEVAQYIKAKLIAR